MERQTLSLRMYDLLLNHGTVMVCCIFLIIYHVCNVAVRQCFHPEREWKRNDIELRVGPKRIVALPIWSSSRVHTRMPDFTAKQISSAGYIIRYLARQVPPFVVYGPRKPLQRFFLRDDLFFHYPEAKEFVRKHTVVPMKEYVEVLKQNGVKVIVLPVPTKTIFERNLLPKILPPEKLFDLGRTKPEVRQGMEDPEGVYRVMTDAFPSDSVDLLSVYKKMSKTLTEELYIPDDVHWSSYGISVAASQIILKLRSDGWGLGAPEIEWVRTSPPHDHWRLMVLPDYFLDRSPFFAWQQNLYQLKPVSEARKNFRVVVAGTSFGFVESWSGFGLGAVLARALNAELVDRAISSGNLDGSVRNLDLEGFKFRAGDLFVWEMSPQVTLELKSGLPKPRFEGSGHYPVLSSHPVVIQK